MAEQVGIRELLESGVHFGHQTRRWNPKMRRFIHGERDGIYIIDLLKTQTLLENAQRFAAGIANRGGTVLFVGTKKQARDAVKETAEAAGMPYVNQRWLGGLLTNFQTISNRIKRLHDLERYEREGQLALLPTRERLAAEADLTKLRANLGGVKHMQRTPDAMFVIDLKTEAIAVKEAQRLRIPIIGLVDTNVDPDGIDYVVPGNDDAIKSCALIARAIGSVVSEGHQRFRAEEERARKEAEEKARREAEERARKEAEERARKEAEERARQEQLVKGGEGRPRQEAEAEVAQAVAAGGRPNPDPAVRQKADRTEAKTSRKKAGDSDKAPAPAAEAGEPLTNQDVKEAEAEAAGAAQPAAAEAAPETPAAEAAPETPAAEAAPETPAAEAAPETPAAEAAPENGTAAPAQPNATDAGGDEPKTADNVGVVTGEAPTTPNENADEEASK